jgi:predicted DNA-binding transcriptional regulator AlpA
MVTEDRLLTVAEAAAMLKTTKDHLYRHWQEYPFAFKLTDRQLRFSLQGIQEYIQEKRHAGARVQAG